MRKLFLKRFALLFLPLLLLAATGVLAGQTQQAGATPLVIGYYGSPDSPAALGMQVAIEEMSAFGEFQGGDGQTYQFFGFVTDNLALLQDATAVLVTPDSPAPDALTSLNMPVIILSSDADLALPNVEANFFRGMTSSRVMLQTLADFAVRSNAAQRFSLIGDSALYKEDFEALAAALSLADQSGSLTVQNIAQAQPLPEDIQALLEVNPQVVVYRGEMDAAAAVMVALHASGWTGVFVYDRAFEAAQAGLLAPVQGVQVVGLTPWAPSVTDSLGTAFLHSYIEKTGRLPDALAVSAYDVTWAMRLMVRRLGADPAALISALPRAEVISTTQGQIDPANYGGDELFRSVTIYELQTLGGMKVLARYDNGQRITEEGTVAAATPTPSQPFITATPSGPVVTVTVSTLNVRSGPGFEYPKVGSLKQGDAVGVLGTVPDFSWFYIQASNGMGWVKAEYVQLYNPAGGVTGIPQVPIPPTPTVAPTPIQGQADIVIDSVTLNPPRPIRNQQFTATVTLRNAGNAPSGGFAVAASFNPGNVYSAAIVGAVQPGQTITALLNVTLTTAGAASGVQVVADLNNEVPESNEANNSFPISYVVDAAPISELTNAYAVQQLNFAGPNVDLDWTGAALNGLNGTTVGVIAGIPYEQTHVGLLTAAAITNPTVGTIAPGTVFGMRTGDGQCGVVRIDNVVGATITITFRIYAAGDC